MTTVRNQTTIRKTVRCRDAPNNKQRQVAKPIAVELYTMGMGGVAYYDRQIAIHLSTHACLERWKKLFIYPFEITYCHLKVILQASPDYEQK